MSPELRETELELERWGFLPLAATDPEVDKRVADWYKAQGLALPDGDRSAGKRKAPQQEAVIMSAPPANDAALTAAEAALAAAQAALAYARSMSRPAA